MHRVFWLLLLPVVFILLDFYVFQAVKTATTPLSAGTRKIIHIGYWSLTGITIILIIFIMVVKFQNVSNQFRNFFISWFFGLLFAKIFISLFLLIDDFRRLLIWVAGLFASSKAAGDVPQNIGRSEFLAKAGLIAGTLPFVSMAYGVVSGAHDYRIHRHKIKLKNLPAAFNGLKIGQLSDIHAGSFHNKKAVTRGVEMLLDERPDLIFFTGDLVNHEAAEMKNYMEVFEKVKAPMGVFSILGNHDYGDYIEWPSKEAKAQNLQNVIGIHKKMGWDILINENRIIEKDGEKISIIGIEHWGARGNFPKYGKLDKAYKGTEGAAVKLLLSHDPSHWRAQVLKDYKDIDITFSGHTHGFQFGIENKFIKWSPVKYFYDEWAGLYSENNQHLYVNRGFGYIGFPGRIGILPEITIIELEKC